MQTKAAKKSLIRVQMLEKRRAYTQSLQRGEKQCCGESVRDLLLSLIPRQPAAIASYMPFREELDPLPLMQALKNRGFAIGLPFMDQNNLVFRPWAPETVLEKSAFGFMAPPEDAALFDPEIVLVPLIAFDAAGHRLGYGHGHYDRALNALRARKKITAIGLAYDIQRIGLIPYEPTDENLDWIVTEKKIYQARSLYPKVNAPET